jgi:hypothetical protein
MDLVHSKFSIARKHNNLGTGTVSVFRLGEGDNYSGGSLTKGYAQ